MNSFLEIFPFIYQISVLTVLLSLLFLFYSINKRLKSSSIRNAHVFNLPETNDTDKKTDNILSELRVLIDADRITLLRFHNGQEFLPNNPVWKLTGTSIVRADGVSDETVNDLLISRIQPLISPLITGVTDDSCLIPPTCERCPNGRQCEDTNRRVIGFDVEKMNGYSKTFLQRRGTGYAYLAALTNNDMKIFGVLMIEYGNIPSGEVKLTRIIQNICNFTARLCFLFN